MTQALIWWLEFSPRWLSCLNTQWRSQQEVLRAASFHAGQVWCGPAPLPDKLSRVWRRACADTITLLHGHAETQLQLCSALPLPLPEHEAAQTWRWGQKLQQRTGQICLHGLVDMGRTLLR